MTIDIWHVGLYVLLIRANWSHFIPWFPLTTSFHSWNPKTTHIIHACDDLKRKILPWFPQNVLINYNPHSSSASCQNSHDKLPFGQKSFQFTSSFLCRLRQYTKLKRYHISTLCLNLNTVALLLLGRLCFQFTLSNDNGVIRTNSFIFHCLIWYHKVARWILVAVSEWSMGPKFSWLR